MRSVAGFMCFIVLLLPAFCWAQADTPAEEPAEPDPALTAAVKALVGTVSVLSQEIRRQREDIDRLNKEVATLKKQERESSPGEPGAAVSGSPLSANTLEERLESQRAARLELIEATATIELEIIDALAETPAEPEAKQAHEAKISLMQQKLETQKKGVQVATAKIALLQRYIAARDEIEATDPSLLLPFDPTAPQPDPKTPIPSETP